GWEERSGFTIRDDPLEGKKISGVLKYVMVYFEHLLALF
ncbi:hypothetical protein NPIL_231181, partial [Nephila pilipes]